MIDLDRDYLEALAIMEGTSMRLPTIAHLRALQIHHEDTLIQVAMKVGRLHDEIFSME